VLTKMVLKMLLKATIPLVMVVGVSSYMMYMRGGDPLALAKTLVGNSVQDAKASVQGAQNSLQSVSPVDLPGSKTTVYKWVDENGNTQFGSTPPPGVNATAKTYNNNANLMSAVKVPTQPSNTAPQPGLGADGQPLPGVAGMNLPVSMDPAVLSELLQSMQQQQ